MELLIRIVDRSDRIDDSKSGDVIAAKPDGWAWSEEEQTNSFWRIVRVPLDEAEVAVLLESGVPRDAAEAKSGQFHRRKYKIDLKSLPGPVCDALNISTDTKPVDDAVRPETGILVFADMVKGDEHVVAFMAAVVLKPEVGDAVDVDPAEPGGGER